jgi:hypothetical protein
MKRELDEFEDVSYFHWSTELGIFVACLAILALEIYGIVLLF